MSGIIAATTVHAYDEELAEQVLRPYRPDCRYLRSCVIQVEGDPRDGGRVTGRADFHIGESWYIADTGHFNSVEFNLCSNQLGYYMFAKAAQDGLMWPFSRWSMAEYRERQLGSILITDFRSSFRRPLDPASFQGELSFVRIVERLDVVIIQARSRFWDAAGGRCSGEFRVAVVGPPGPGRAGG